MNGLQKRMGILPLTVSLLCAGCSEDNVQRTNNDFFTSSHVKEPVCTTGSAFCSSEPLQPDTLPVLTIHSDNIEILAVQSSYCWNDLGCVDIVSDSSLLRNQILPIVSPGAPVDLVFPYEPAPSQVQVTLLDAPASSDPVISLQDRRFQAPLAHGMYVYTFQAYWTSEDGMYSQGDTSFVFGFQVQ